MTFEIPKIDRVEIHAARPEPADLRWLARLAEGRAAKLAPVTWLYKLYVPALPEPRGALLELLVGDTPIRRYSEFPGGIYFTVNDPDLVQALAGQPICFRQEGEAQVHDTGVRMPQAVARQRAATAPETAVATELPLQLELLRK